jgi:nitrous oxidase accessory protein NosD
MKLLGYPIVCTTLIVCFLYSPDLDAATIRVPADQPTIQAAINAASNGDVVQVARGTYVENINFMGKAIHVVSEQGPQVTIIDGNQAGSVVTFGTHETPDSVLNGFTLQNGMTTFDGGGIFVSYASPTIVGNIITNNIAGDGGAGIMSYHGSPVIQGNVIKNNGQIPGYAGGIGGGGVAIGGLSSAQLLNNIIVNNSWATANGGGVTLNAAGTPTVQNNLIANNATYGPQGQGGGLYLMNQSDASIVQNVITGNFALAGGGVYWNVPPGARGPFLINNTIYGNEAVEGSGVFADGSDVQAKLVNNIIVAFPGEHAVTCGNFNDVNPPIFQNNDVVAPGGYPYTGLCTNQTGLNGNISADPLFANAGAGDFHLQPGSPAIDAGINSGTPQADFDGVARPLDGNGDGIAVIDLGAYEANNLDHTPPATSAAASPASNGAGWNNANVTVAFNATDNTGGSGVANIRYWLLGAQQSDFVVAGNPASITISAEGITNVGYSAVDNAGNSEWPKSLTFAIDKSSPVIAGLPKNCQLTPVKHQLVQVATVTVTDSVSGVSSFSVTATSSDPDSGTSPDDVPGDIVINGGTVQLRAERIPGGTGRIYTITANASDFAGNTTTATATCTVPK